MPKTRSGMETQQTPRELVVKDVEDDPILQELDLPGLFREHKRRKAAEAKAKALTAAVRDNILTALQTAKADKGVWTDARGNFWQATITRKAAGEKLNQASLKRNMGKFGGLDAGTVRKIFAKSMDPVDEGDPYVVVTVPKDNDK